MSLLRYLRTRLDARMDAAAKSCRGFGCSACCRSDVMAHPMEIGDIAAVVPADRVATIRARAEEPISLASLSRPCPLLDGDGGCSIYAHRPLVCRAYAVTSPPKRCESGTPVHALPAGVTMGEADNLLPGGKAAFEPLVWALARRLA